LAPSLIPFKAQLTCFSERKTIAMGRARVARDSMSDTFKDVEMKEKEEAAANSIALAKFLSKRGKTPPAAVPAQAASEAPEAAPVTPAHNGT